ncbi:2-phosphosulfolactate phosphatase, partial [archaeon]|nr:2-phosphosulfolactate phosphatase [archaeon]
MLVASRANKAITLSALKYRLNAKGLIGQGDIFVPEGKNLRTYLKTPEALILKDFDIVFNSHTPLPAQLSRISVFPKKINQYNIDFSNKTIVQTTGGGTQGIVNAKNADEIITGGFVNALAVINYIKKKNPK